MKLLSLLFYVKILALVACLCVADQSSRGLRDDQKTELSSISAVTTSVLPEATSQGSDVTQDVTKQKLILANQVDRKLSHEQSPRLHEHEGPDKVRELCIGCEPPPGAWVPNREFGRCYYNSWQWSGPGSPSHCCETYFPNQSPEQRSECFRQRPRSHYPPAVGWYTPGDWGHDYYINVRKRCFYYDGSNPGSEIDSVGTTAYYYCTKEQCCNDNYPANYVLSDGKRCTDLVGIISNGVYYPDTMNSAPTTSKPTSSRREGIGAS